MTLTITPNEVNLLATRVFGVLRLLPNLQQKPRFLIFSFFKAIIKTSPVLTVFVLHQERYWRIPEDLSPAELRSRAAVLDEDAELPAEPAGDQASGAVGGDQAARRKQKLQAMAKQKRKEMKEGKKRKTNRWRFFLFSTVDLEFTTN